MKNEAAVNALAELNACLAGRYLTAVIRREYDWAFAFTESAALRAECPWRILVKGRIAFASSDDGHKFGLPAPLDGEEVARRLLGQKAIERSSVRTDTGDLSITFADQTILEVINLSSGYEGWEIGAAGIKIIATGGGRLTIFGGRKT
jgi:hypothetical protein